MKTKMIFSGSILTMVLIMIIGICPLQAQQMHSFTGRLIEKQNNEPAPYATIALFDSTGTILLGGTISDLNGAFILNADYFPSYTIRISAMGFVTIYKKVEISKPGTFDLGTIFLVEGEISLEGIVVEGQRIRASAEPDKTTFFVNQNMQKASNVGTDILRLIPGVQLDIRQNISLEGSQNILILVNGRERDGSFIRQLKASQIDRVEVINNPSAQYDANVTGVINIILGKDREAGFDGNIYAELPVSAKEVYTFPTYSLNYESGKFNFFTSYNGELSYFDIEEGYHREFQNGNGLQEITSTQYIAQKNWSHRFHYGLDYVMNGKNQFNFYGFFNPYSQEHDGRVELQRQGYNPLDWNSTKEDDDKNQSGFYSLYYKHLFDQGSGHELSIDMSLYNMKGENTTRFFNDQTGYDQVNTTNPLQQIISAKVDYSRPLLGTLKLITGIQARQQELEDSKLKDFGYVNTLLAAHGTLSYADQKFNMAGGVRYENSAMGLSNSPTTTKDAWLPSLSVTYKFNSAANLSFSFRNAISYPGFYSLQPNTSILDPFTQQAGNSNLKPVRREKTNLTYSHRFNNHFVSTGLFYHKSKDVINMMSVMNANEVLQSQRHNLGDITQLGIQITAALSLGTKAGFNPTMKVFQVQSTPNNLALANNISSREQMAYEAGFSAFASLGKGYTATLIFQYRSPLNEIQSNYFEGAQYFMSLEKDFGRGFKAGMVSAVPLAGQIVYQGNEIDGPDFYNRSEGAIQTSLVPFWLKFSYAFSSGNKGHRVSRQREVIENEKRKGF